MPAGHRVLAHSAPASIMKRSAAAHITRLLPVTDHTRMLFTIARKIWSLRFVCAATTVAPPMAHQYQPTPRNAADCTGTLKSRLTEQFIFPITVAVAQAQWSFRKTTA